MVMRVNKEANISSRWHAAVARHDVKRPAVFSPSAPLNNIIPPALNAHHIAQVDPAVLIAIIEPTPAAIKRPKIAPPTLKEKLIKFAPAAAAGAAFFLAPALASAHAAAGIVTAVSSVLSSFGPIEWLGAAFGTYQSIKLLISKYRELQPANYQSKNMKLNTSNPTLRKLFKTLIVPTWVASVSIGGAFTFFPALENALGLPPGTVSLLGFSALAAKPIITFISHEIRDIKQWVDFKRKGVQRYLPRPHLAGQFLTNLFEPAGWLATLTFMVHMSKVYATQFIGTGFEFAANTAATVGSAANLAALGEYAIAFGASAAAFQLLIGATKDRIDILKTPTPRLVSAAAWGLGGAAVGAIVYLASPGLVTTNFLTFAINLAFAHSTIHSLRSQEGGIRQASKKQPVFDQQSLWRAVRSAAGASRTVFKPCMDSVDPLTSSYASALISEGANAVLNVIISCLTPKGNAYVEAQEMIEKLFKPDLQLIRNIIKQGWQSMQQAGTAQEAAEAAADTFDNISKLFIDPAFPGNGGHPLALGNLKSRSNLPYLKDSLFCAGLPGSTLARSDQDIRVLGEHIRFAATLFREKANRLRSMDVAGLDLDSLKANLTGKLEAAFRRAFIPADAHPSRFNTVILHNAINGKQCVVDLCMQIMADFVGYMEMPVMTPDGRIQLFSIPLKVVKDFKEDHETVLALGSRDEQGEDLRFAWYERAEKDIGDSCCSIAFLDNAAHYRKYQRLLAAGTITDSQFLQLYPTTEVPTVPVLKNEPQADAAGIIEPQEFYDVVYKNGARLRVFADGSQRAIGTLPPDAPAVLMLPGTNRHGFVAQTLAANNDQRVFGSIPLDANIKDVLKQGKVPHPFGGNFNDDKYTMPRWHFMYPTEYFSISDADQVDINVTNLRLFHTRKNPHLRVMMVRPRPEDLPFSADMLEEPQDSFLEAGIAVVWMTLKVKLKNGKTLIIPLNKNKESERSFGGELWRYIDQERPVAVDPQKMTLKIPYTPRAQHDPAFRAAQNTGLMLGGKYNNRESIEEVEIPIELADLVPEIAEVRINPERYGEVGGPRPVVDYFFVRRNQKNEVTDLTRQQSLTDRVANMLIFGKIALLSKTEVDHWETVIDAGQPTPKEDFPWTDDASNVHFKLSAAEYSQLQPWIPAWQGQERPQYINGELVMHVKHFELLCSSAYQQFTYRRFMPDVKYRTYFDPSEIGLGDN